MAVSRSQIFACRRLVSRQMPACAHQAPRGPAAQRVSMRPPPDQMLPKVYRVTPHRRLSGQSNSHTVALVPHGRKVDAPGKVIGTVEMCSQKANPGSPGKSRVVFTGDLAGSNLRLWPDDWLNRKLSHNPHRCFLFRLPYCLYL
jgi:hypothetical protein